MDKRKLRSTLRKKNIDPACLKQASRIIQNKVMSLPEYRKSRKVFCYVSVNGEVATDLILKDALDNKELLVPKCLDKGIMKAIKISSLDELVRGSYGIPEPVGSVAEEDYDLVIVPCLCAGKNGERLGHGAGYYDRFLQESRRLKICLCMEENIREDIPMEQHDLYMDLVITEENIYENRL